MKTNKLILTFVVGVSSSDQDANVIPFQGQLANQSGQPLLPTSPSALALRRCRQAVGGIAIWEESQPNISVNTGRFSILLGSRTELLAAPDFNATRYLGITVDDGNPATADVEMRPRQGGYADPPWTYRDKANAGQRGVFHKYPLMTVSQICALNVADIADFDCMLAMWWVAPMPAEALGSGGGVGVN